mmetsp:Transcript_29997/g.96794  ORF Transcript_29997/g.96794 Transcript_29997/m.96794 type:complete len:311 (-) Transcript_29997:324-1256(-)
MVTGMRWKGSRWMRARMSGTLVTGRPSKSRTTSLALTPALSAGEPGMVWAMTTLVSPGVPQMPSASTTATILKPTTGLVTWPCFRRWRTTCHAESIGIAKEMPSAIWAFIVLMPTTWPSRSTRGPPELPTLMAQSTCRKSVRWAMPISEPCRAVADTIPHVTEFARFRGLPRATTKSPGTKREELPIETVGNRGRPFVVGEEPLVVSIWTRATSDDLSMATNLQPRNRRPSFRVTVIDWPFRITWAFVTTSPSSRTMNPEPADTPRLTPNSVASDTSTVIFTTAGNAFAAARDTKFRCNRVVPCGCESAR